MKVSERNTRENQGFNEEYIVNQRNILKKCISKGKMNNFGLLISKKVEVMGDYKIEIAHESQATQLSSQSVLPCKQVHKPCNHQNIGTFVP